VDPAGSLLPEERARRAAFARKSYMTRLALKASKARSKKAAGSAQEPAPKEVDRASDHTTAS